MDNYSAGDQAFEPRQELDPGDRILMNGGLEYTDRYTRLVLALKVAAVGRENVELGLSPGGIQGSSILSYQIGQYDGIAL